MKNKENNEIPIQECITETSNLNKDQIKKNLQLEMNKNSELNHQGIMHNEVSKESHEKQINELENLANLEEEHQLIDQVELSHDDLEELNDNDDEDEDESLDESYEEDKDEWADVENIEKDFEAKEDDMPIDDDSYDEYDYENIPEFADAQTLIERYFEEQSNPKAQSRGKASQALKCNMTEIPEEGEGEEAGDKSLYPSQPSQIIKNEDEWNSNKINESNTNENNELINNFEESENEKELFSNYLCTNEISEKKIECQSLDLDLMHNLKEVRSLNLDYIQMSSAKKSKATKMLDISEDEKISIIKIQSKFRQFLAKKS